MPELRRRWTVAERDQFPNDCNRYEVVDGELLMTPGPTWRHQDAASRLYVLLADYLDKQRVGHPYLAPADVVFGPERGVHPDLFVTPLVDGGPPRHFDEVRRLLLAAETLSPSTARSDRVTKRTLYREEVVPEYWIVDLDAGTIARTTPANERPEVLAERLVCQPEGTSAPLVIDVPAYFATLPGA